MLNKEKYETGDGGTILVEDNDIKNDSGMFTSIYLALFSTKSTWWGNSIFETTIESETETALSVNSTNEKGLDTIKRAVIADLSTLTFATFTVNVILVDFAKISINIEASNNETMQIIWDATEKQIIETKIL